MLARGAAASRALSGVRSVSGVASWGPSMRDRRLLDEWQCVLPIQASLGAQ